MHFWLTYYIYKLKFVHIINGFLWLPNPWLVECSVPPLEPHPRRRCLCIHDKVEPFEICNKDIRVDLHGKPVHHGAACGSHDLETIEEWLDLFEMFSIYEILPEILELWGSNLFTDVKARKN